MYNLLVDELDADPTLLNIRGETVGPDGVHATRGPPSNLPGEQWLLLPPSMHERVRA